MFSSCASAPPAIQPQVNSLVAAQQFSNAVKVLGKHSTGYGKNNQLLYLLDYGLTLQLSGRYRESAAVFEKARIKFDELYTRSVSRLAASWAWNDYAQPYHGEDFERVLINIFQAVNFAVLGDISGALVEARDADSTLGAINAQYAPGQKNVYKEDALARLFMGIMYEAGTGRMNLNDAFISYQKALAIYEGDYLANYKTRAPEVLKENLLTTAAVIDKAKFDSLRRQFKDTVFYSPADKTQKVEVYLIHYHGLAPLKYSDSIVVPLPGGYLTKFVFPRYQKRIFSEVTDEFVARQGGRPVASARSEITEDIAAIALQNLANRKTRTIAKAAARPAGKYFLERQSQEYIREKKGAEAARWFRYGSNWYNILSEQADLRAWQTLPGEIRLSRLVLDPGEYDLSFGQNIWPAVELKAGEKKFFVTRTSR